MKPSEMRVLITGGTGGIGRAIGAELLARGAAVLLVARDEAALSRAASSHAVNGARIGMVSADLTVPADRQRVCKAASAWCGGINVLINNAGVNHFTMFEDQPPAQIDLALALNVGAPMHLCRELLPHLARSGRGAHPQYRLGLRHDRISRLCRVLGQQVRAAWVHRGAAS